MQSTNIRQIKAALWEQAFIGGTQVRCPTGQVVAVRKRKGQIQAMIFGWGRWYPVESVSIERLVVVAPVASWPVGVIRQLSRLHAIFTHGIRR
jgi:hypothetical protein